MGKKRKDCNHDLSMFFQDMAKKTIPIEGTTNCRAYTKREILSLKDVMAYYGCCKNTASFKMCKVRYVLNKPKRSNVTAQEFAEVHNINADRLLENMNKVYK